MSAKHTLRSDEEWMRLVTECRQSGLSDKVWSEQHGIPSSTFYNAIGRLRKKACDIPEPVRSVPAMDLTSRRQDVVQIDIVPDEDPGQSIPITREMSVSHLDNSHTIEIILDGSTSMRICNSADPLLLEKVIGILRRALC